MKQIKRGICLVMAAAMTVALAACGAGPNMKKDSQTYIQGLLDKYYKGQYNQEYLDLVDLTEAEAKEQYEDWLYQEVDYFSYYFAIDYPTEEFNDAVAEMYKEVYAKADYTVHEATKLSSGNYAVEVTVKPVDIMLQVTDDDAQDALTEAYDEVTDGVDVEKLSDAEAEELTKKWDENYAWRVLDLVKSHLDEIGYGEEKSMVFQLAEDSDGYYSLVEGDLQNFDSYVISY